MKIVIFHSYVSLPEGMQAKFAISILVFGVPRNADTYGYLDVPPTFSYWPTSKKTMMGPEGSSWISPNKHGRPAEETTRKATSQPRGGGRTLGWTGGVTVGDPKKLGKARPPLLGKWRRWTWHCLINSRCGLLGFEQQGFRVLTCSDQPQTRMGPLTREHPSSSIPVRAEPLVCGHAPSERSNTKNSFCVRR